MGAVRTRSLVVGGRWLSIVVAVVGTGGSTVFTYAESGATQRESAAGWVDFQPERVGDFQYALRAAAGFDFTETAIEPSLHSFSGGLHSAYQLRVPSVASTTGAKATVYDLDAVEDRADLLEASLAGSACSVRELAAKAPQSVFAPSSRADASVFLSFQRILPALDKSTGETHWTPGIEHWNSSAGLTFGSADPVPEPGTYGAIGALILATGAGWRAQRKKRKNAALVEASTLPSKA